MNSRQKDTSMCTDIAIRTSDDSVKKRVEAWFLQEFPPTDTGRGYNAWNFYTIDIDRLFIEFTKSERNLLMLIGVITLIAILIALFGIYSMITITCNQRRKEIAIRKVNGAKAKEIFLLFFREYFILALFSCVVAFPVGVYIMHPLAGTIKENPTDVVKSK